MNGMWEELKSVLDEMIEKYVPERRRRGMGKLDEELAKLIERKKRLGINIKGKRGRITRP